MELTWQAGAGGLHPGETAVSGLWTDLSSWPGCPPWLLSDPKLPAFSSRSGACVFVDSAGCWRDYLSGLEHNP